MLNLACLIWCLAGPISCTVAEAAAADTNAPPFPSPARQPPPTQQDTLKTLKKVFLSFGLVFTALSAVAAGVGSIKARSLRPDLHEPFAVLVREVNGLASCLQDTLAHLRNDIGSTGHLSSLQSPITSASKDLIERVHDRAQGVAARTSGGKLGDLTRVAEGAPAARLWTAAAIGTAIVAIGFQVAALYVEIALMS